MLQQLPELLERAVAAIAGIAVVTTGLQQSLELLLRMELQQSLGLLSRAQGCSNRWDCCYEQRVAAVAGTAVLKRCGRGWILPLITALVTMTKFYCEAVQDVC